jgi:lysophospholipase L1-like esterase
MEIIDHNRANITYLALGDSYTIGEGVSKSERWPVKLARTLKEKGYAMDDPRIIAKTGWTTAELIAEIERIRLTGPFAIVSLLIGVNNQYRGESIDKYRLDFENLLEQAIEFAENQSTRVIVFSIPDWGVTPFAKGRDRARIGREIDEYNAYNRDGTLIGGAHYVDITEITRKASNDPDLLASDGLHPSGQMYQRWVNKVLPTVERILRELNIGLPQ